MADRTLIRKMTRYTAWADDVMLSNTAMLPPEEFGRKRDTLFGSITGTFDHVLLIGEVFRAHLEGRKHGYKSRARDEDRPFDTVAAELRTLNSYYVSLADTWNADNLDEVIRFTFVGGGQGAMTRSEILLHLPITRPITGDLSAPCSILTDWTGWRTISPSSSAMPGRPWSVRTRPSPRNDPVLSIQGLACTGKGAVKSRSVRKKRTDEKNAEASHAAEKRSGTSNSSGAGRHGDCRTGIHRRLGLV